MTEKKMKNLYSGNLSIAYGQFYIDVPYPGDLDDDYDDDKFDHLDLEDAFKKHENGICGSAQSGKIYFVAGVQDGTIAIDVELHCFEPLLDQSFEEIVEVSF